MNIYIFKVACDITCRYLNNEISADELIRYLDLLNHFLDV